VHAGAELRLRMANERIARGHRDAARARQAEQARRRHRISLRQSVGRSMIELGRRLAAEQSLNPVRSR
jgi:hypothetical protein